MTIALLSGFFCSFSLKTCNSNHKIISSNRNEYFEQKFDSWLYKFRGVFCAFYGIMKWMRKNTQPGIWTPLWQTVHDSTVNMYVSVNFNYVCLLACCFCKRRKNYKWLVCHYRRKSMTNTNQQRITCEQSRFDSSTRYLISFCTYTHTHNANWQRCEWVCARVRVESDLTFLITIKTINWANEIKYFVKTFYHYYDFEWIISHCAINTLTRSPRAAY